MKNIKPWKLLLVFLLLGIFLFNFASAECTSCGDAIMHLTQERMIEMQKDYDSNIHITAADIPKPSGGGIPPTSHDNLPFITYTPNQRNQGSCGDCWVWGGTAAMEMAHAVNNNFYDRLSTQWFNSRYNNGGPGGYACCGGWLSDFATFYSTGGLQFTVPWSNNNANFVDAGTCCADPTQCPAPNDRTTRAAATITTTPNFAITSIQAQTIQTIGVPQATAIANIKAVVDNNEAVVFTFFLPVWDSTPPDLTGFRTWWGNTNENGVYQMDRYDGVAWSSTTGGGHLVTIVGYDDSVPGSEYWIVLNSWGTAGGLRPNGLFRIPWNMNYGCSNPGRGQALYFERLAVQFPENNANPIANIGGTYCGRVNIAVSFNGAASSDPNAGDSIAAYDWNWGDGTAHGSGPTPTHTYTSFGLKSVQLRVQDNHGAWSPWVATTADINAQPVANPGGPYSGNVNQVITFNVVGSTDAYGGTINQYEWDWNNDGTFEFQSGSPVTTHSFTSTQTVGFRVRDSFACGAGPWYSNPVTFTVTINIAPVAEANGPYNTIVGQTVTFSSAGSHDTDGSIVSYDWNWGDATAHGSGASPTHAYATGGIKTVTLTVTDNGGATGTDTATVNVNVPPHAEANGPYAGSINQVITFSSASSTDPDGSIVSYDWNWGDGTAHGTGVSPTHPYTSAGTKTVTLTVTDNGPAVATGTDTATVNIRTPCEDINNLKAMVTGMTLTPTIRTALNTRLNKASTLCAKGPGQYPAIATLFKKDFIPYVNSKTRKGITPAQATTLLDQANLIIAACGG
jgi:PKD repeat protein